MTVLYLVRHGESTWNNTGRYQGRIDTELSALGQQQAQALAEGLRDVPFDALYSSPLRRALVTALYIAAERGQDVLLEPGLVEIDHGQWNGLLREEVEKRFGPLLQLWQTQPAQAQMPGGENLEQVRERVVAALSRMVEVYPQGTIFVCTHDAVLRVILCWALDLPLDQIWSVNTENASISIIEVTDGEPRLVCLNDTCHLGELRSDLSEQAL